MKISLPNLNKSLIECHHFPALMKMVIFDLLQSQGIQQSATLIDTKNDFKAAIANLT